MLKPITLTLYAPDYEESGEKKEFIQGFIPWKFLKQAMRLSKQLGSGESVAEQLNDELVDALTDLVVAVFGGRFSKEDLESKAEMMDVISVIQQIVAFAGGSLDPTEPGNRK